ncbi:DcaP family trimeric outer membrane transporter [Dechloromonas sp. ZS-1]|uniref:DcaP family trimeric outer membrane transporter n=1 Tax=Dechloromonas sp. ZS-1 TaxID=3138067 RepID=UPI0031FC0A8F
MQLKHIALAIAALGAGTQAFAAGNAAAEANRIAQLESQLKAMQAQIEELKNIQKTQSTAQKSQKEELAQLQDQVVAQGKEVVVAGDLPNSMRLASGDTSIRVYGIAEMNMVRENKGTNADNDYSTFMPYAPLRGSAAANRTGQTYLHARTSRFGIEASTPTQYGQLVAKIEGDFNNDPRTGNSAVYGDVKNIYSQQATNSYDFRLRHAYFQLAGWTVGQTWSTFMDLDATPEVVDFNGPIGGTFIRQPQVRYTYATQNYGNFSAAVENSVSYVLKDWTATTDGFSKTADVVLRWDRAFTWGTMSLRGVSHEHAIEDGKGLNVSRRGYGVGAAVTYKPTDNDLLSLNVTGGDGIGRYFNFIEGAAYDQANRRIVLERSLGVVAGYQHKFSDTLRMNIAYGFQKTYDNEYTQYARTNLPSDHRWLTNNTVSQLHIGAIWNPVKYVDIGAEYIYGRRETILGERGDMSRINLMGRYNFN